MCLQVLVYVTIGPFSRYWRQRCNDIIVWWWYLIIIWGVEWWGGFQVRCFSPNNDFPDGVIPSENTIVLGNHYGDVDWMMGWIVAEKVGTLGNSKCYLKHVTQYVPILGWSWKMSDFIFLRRDWAEDKAQLHKAFKTLRDYPKETPWWIGLFCEGTRQSEEKIKASQEWCRENGRPVMRHILYPKTKGFAVSAVELKGKLDAVYSITLGCPDPNRAPSFGALLRGEQPVLQLCMSRWAADDLPETEEAMKQFCADVHVKKDLALRECKRTGRFPGTEFAMKRNPHSAVAMAVWFVLVQGLILYWAMSVNNAAYAVVGVYAGFGLLLGFVVKVGEKKHSKNGGRPTVQAKAGDDEKKMQ